MPVYRVGAVCLLMAGAAACAQDGPALDSPRDFQVFQRQTRALGTIVTAGRAGIECDAAEARLSGKSPFGTLSGEWERLPFDPRSRTFRGDLRAPAGGWYHFELRLRKDGRTVSEFEVGHVGVGEVFIVAGQSNSTNFGEVRQRTRSGMVAAFSGREWSIADDPQPGVQDESRKGSFIPAFGDDLYEKYHVPIGVASVGYGATSVRQWLPKGGRFEVPPTMSRFVHRGGAGGWECDGTLFDGMMKIVSALGRDGFRALLWHQGESDAHQGPGHDIAASEYRRLLEAIIRSSRRQAGWEFPWFVAQVSYHTPADPCTPEIRAAQEALWREGLAREGPDTDQLTGDNRQNGGKGVHFSGKGLQAHGSLWAEKVEVWLDPVLR